MPLTKKPILYFNAIIQALPALLLSACALSARGDGSGGSRTLPPWEEGYLDIHHISVAGDAAYFVFPDGTTMLFDAGGSDKERFDKAVAPLVAAPIRPDASKREGEWLVDYIQNVAPARGRNMLDYAVISHFHGDHFGVWRDNAPVSQNGTHRLSGITDVAEMLTISTLIDRGFPSYDYPVDLRATATDRKRNLGNYLDFIESRAARGLNTESLRAGVSDQIRLRNRPERYPGFEVRNIKTNGTAWRGVGDETEELFTPAEIVTADGSFNENPLSLALRISYGPFDYFTGGDMTGVSGGDFPDWFDVETPIAPVIGEVDVFSLNHHGVRDANNDVFISTLKPQIFILQGRTTDHPGQEVAHRMISENLYEGERSIFATYLHDQTKAVYGPWFLDKLVSDRGHVVIRVFDRGRSFFVYVLDDLEPGANVIAEFGPYTSRN